MLYSDSIEGEAETVFPLQTCRFTSETEVLLVNCSVRQSGAKWFLFLNRVEAPAVELPVVRQDQTLVSTAISRGCSSALRRFAASCMLPADAASP